MNCLTNFFNQTSKTTLYPELKVQLFVHNFLTTHFWLKSDQLLTSLSTFLPIGQKDGVSGNAHVIVLIQQQFQCSSLCMNERAPQTEDPSQRAKDNKQGTFLLTLNIPCIMMATSCVVSARCNWRCVTSLFIVLITFKHFQKKRWNFLTVSVFFCVFV